MNVYACYNKPPMKSESYPPPLIRADKAIIAYKRQMRLQVYLPLGLFTVVLAALVAWMWVGGVGDASSWADVALIMLIIPALLLGLIAVAAIVALAVLVGKLIDVIPEPAYRVRKIFRRAERETARATDLALRPVVKLTALWAALRAIGKALASLVGIE